TAVVLWITAAGAAAGRAPAPSASVAAAAPRQVGPSATLRAPAPSRAPTAPPAPTSLAAPAPAPTTPIQMLAASGELDLVNHERASASLPPLAWNPCLAGVAGTQSRRLAQQGYVSPADGTAAAAGCRLALTPTAELLAYWPGLNDTQVNAMLIANPGDRAVLLGPYRYLGACWTVGPTGLAFLAIELA
ncbi:MAG TPA: CAP domain-containing protein, partial [Candidatus Dormibacteraeota bacterium]